MLQVRDPGGTSGAYTPVTIFGESLGSITSVLSDSPQLSATLEPGGTNTQVQLSVFVRPGAAPGRHTLLLSGPRGTVPIAFTVKPAELEAEDDSHAIRAPAARPSAKSALLSREKLLERDEELPARTSRTAISGVFPANLKPGDVVEGKLFGTNLGNVTSVRTSGSGIRVEVLEARPSELRVRFTVDEEADSGSRLLTVKAGENKATTTVEVAAPRNRLAATPSGRVAETAGDSAQTVARPEASGRAATPRDTNVSLALPDLVVRAEDFTMTPVNPRPGDTVTFHIRVRNAGGRRVEDAPIEFSIVGTAVRQHEQITLEPGASQTFDFEWKAAGTGRLEPRVAIDPQNRIEQVTRANKIAALGPFELVSPAGSLGAVGAGGPPVHGAATRQREQLHLPLGACVGFRLASGTEQSCGGGADFEMRSGPEGNTLVIEADGVRNLGGVPLDQVTAASGEALAATETVVAGATYLIQTRRGVAALRVAQVRGLGAARSVPPATLRGPRLGGVEREPRAVEERSGVTVVLEWRVLPQ